MNHNKNIDNILLSDKTDLVISQIINSQHSCLNIEVHLLVNVLM